MTIFLNILAIVTLTYLTSFSLLYITVNSGNYRNVMREIKEKSR